MNMMSVDAVLIEARDISAVNSINICLVHIVMVVQTVRIPNLLLSTRHDTVENVAASVNSSGDKENRLPMRNVLLQ